MPEKASAAKVAASRGYGAEVVLHGDVFAAAAEIVCSRGVVHHAGVVRLIGNILIGRARAIQHAHPDEVLAAVFGAAADGS